MRNDGFITGAMGPPKVAKRSGWELDAKKRQLSELAWTACSIVGVLLLCALAASLTMRMEADRREMRPPLQWPDKFSPHQGPVHPSMVRRSGENSTIESRVGSSTGKDGFFLEIGVSAESLETSKRTIHLEHKGWNGVCATPLPADLASRTCKLVALPVAATSGQKITVPNCPHPPLSLKALISRIVEAPHCPQKEISTVGIEELLVIADAPRVIDFTSLETEGSELDIIKGFPFEKHCVRAWTVNHGYEEHLMSGIRQVLEIGQGCRIREGAGEYWARCPCEKRLS